MSSDANFKEFEKKNKKCFLKYLLQKKFSCFNIHNLKMHDHNQCNEVFNMFLKLNFF